MTVYAVKISDIPKEELKQWEHYLIIYDQICTEDITKTVRHRIHKWLYDSNDFHSIQLKTQPKNFYSLCRTSLVTDSEPLTLEILAQETLLLIAGN